MHFDKNMAGKLEAENIQTIENEVEPNSKLPEFYIISAWKFWILNILTIGCFSNVWFYLQWHRQNRADRERVEPFWRTVFSIFFYHPLVRRVKTQTDSVEVSEKWNGRLIASLAVLSIILSQIFDIAENRLIDAGKDTALVGSMGTLFWVASLYLDWNIQSKINLGYGDPTGASNSKITGRNILWILVF